MEISLITVQDILEKKFHIEEFSEGKDRRKAGDIEQEELELWKKSRHGDQGGKS